MRTTRRQLLSAAAWAGLFGCGGPERRRVVLGAAEVEGAPALLVVIDGAPHPVPTPSRGHGVAVRSDRRRAVVFGRRPADWALELDLEPPLRPRRLTPPDALQMQGHGAFGRDGSLFVSLADRETAEGFVGVWQPEQRRWAAVWPTEGLGPHELLVLPDGAVVVANGGLRTSAGQREPINLDTMDSSLVYLDPRSGRVLERVRAGIPKGSLRHLAVSPQGRVGVGLQIQRAAVGHDRPLPLAFVHDRATGAARILDAPEAARMVDYVGSVAFAPRARQWALTSPRGSLALFFDDEGRLAGTHRFADVCGASATVDGDGFLLSSSTGRLREVEVTAGAVRVRRAIDFDARWDNHLLALARG
mgnify:CR=1 FL=1